MKGRGACRRLTSLALLLATAFAPGCASQTIYRTSTNPALEKTTVEIYRTVVLGLEPMTPAINLGHRCANGWQSVTTEVTVLQATLRVITLNLFSPWTVTISCVAPKPVERDF